AVLLRNEALLLAAALALVATVLALRPLYRVAAGAVTGATVAAALGARLVERLWVAGITGRAVSATSVYVPSGENDFLGGRVEGFVTTWLTPSYGGPALVDVALLTMLAAIGWGAVGVRSARPNRRAVRGGAFVAAGAAVVALVAAPENVVPGLLLAFPLAGAGLFALRRRLFDDPGTGFAGASAALFTLAVLATQYARGGTGEWGGRYFALVVPVAVPLFLAALRAEGSRLAPSLRRTAAGALVVCSVALSVMAVGALRATHRAGADVVARIEAAGRVTGDAEPVVLTTWVAGARLAWPTFDDHRWLYVADEEVGAAVDRLRSAGVGRFVFVADDIRTVRSQLDGLTVVASDVRPSGRQVVVLEAP
ncbi:MAG: hypothetical protein M3203_07225, partial [Actinomycetota bacterium]|nr:hypothetical protein [Actinomycetota bacterium]